MTYSVCSYLQSKIKEAVQKRGESIRWLAKQCGVDYSTIYRLHAGEQRSLSFQNASKILKQIEPDAYLSVLSDFYPFETKALSKVSPEKSEELLAILASDSYLYRVFTFAAETNASREVIQKKFGEDGVALLDKLIKYEILSESEQCMTDNLKGMSYPSDETAKRIALHSYPLTNLSTAGTILEHFRGAVDSEGVRDLYQAAEEYRTKIHKILDSRKGDIVVSGSLISGPME